MRALPSGRRRRPIDATATAASVPSEFATIASTRAGNRFRYACASGIEVPLTGAVSGMAIATPTARPT